MAAQLTELAAAAPSNSPWPAASRRAHGWRRIGVDPVVVAASAQWIAPYPYDQMHVRDRFLPPSRHYLAGTDEYGRDVFSRLLFGSTVVIGTGRYCDSDQHGDRRAAGSDRRLPSRSDRRAGHAHPRRDVGISADHAGAVDPRGDPAQPDEDCDRDRRPGGGTDRAGHAQRHAGSDERRVYRGGARPWRASCTIC